MARSSVVCASPWARLVVLFEPCLLETKMDKARSGKTADLEPDRLKSRIGLPARILRWKRDIDWSSFYFWGKDLNVVAFSPKAFRERVLCAKNVDPIEMFYLIGEEDRVFIRPFVSQCQNSEGETWVTTMIYESDSGQRLIFLFRKFVNDGVRFEVVDYGN